MLFRLLLVLFVPISSYALDLDEQLRQFLGEEVVEAEPDPAEIDEEYINPKPIHMTMILINKHSGRREQINLPLGEVYTWHELLLEPIDCVRWEGLGVAASKAKIQIWNVTPKKKESYFNGWFYVNYPELSSFSHPKYELLLTGCGAE